MRFLIYSLLCFFHYSWAEPPHSFSQSKKIIQQLFQNHPQTLYCGCTYQDKTVDLDSCGMSEAGGIKRAHRIEVEHIVAVQHFGQQFQCWREPICQNAQGKKTRGRACCEKKDADFRQMEAELYNLWPEVGLVNQARSNYRFGVLPSTESYYGCAIKIDKQLKRVEPPDESKGLVARAYLFMAQHYDFKLSDSQRQLFSSWNKQFPPKNWELEWANQVAEIEGYSNPYIVHWKEYLVG